MGKNKIGTMLSIASLLIAGAACAGDDPHGRGKPGKQRTEAAEREAKAFHKQQGKAHMRADHRKDDDRRLGLSGQSLAIPAGHLPQAGECRLWFPNRSPHHQPPPGDCARISAKVPAEAYLVQGSLPQPELLVYHRNSYVIR